MDAISPTGLGLLGVTLFFAILFLQSGIDKVRDWQGNLDWMTPHFKDSPFRGIVKPLLGILTFFELASGLLSAYAAVLLGILIVRTVSAGTTISIGGLATTQAEDPAVAATKIALTVVIATILQLFLGQRLAKAYDAAASLTGYFVIALLGMWMLKP